MKHTLILSLMLVGMTACTAAPTPKTSRPAHWAQSVKADANLHRVDDKLYRSEQPIADDIAAINAAQIRTIVNLRYFNRNRNTDLFAQNPHIRLVNQPLLTWRVRPKDLAAALYQIEQGRKHGAVLVHCYHGADRTGIVIAFYRMIYQNWTLADAKAEMLQGGFGYHSVWKNLENLFTEETLAEVKTELAALRR